MRSVVSALSFVSTFALGLSLAGCNGCRGGDSGPAAQERDGSRADPTSGGDIQPVVLRQLARTTAPVAAHFGGRATARPPFFLPRHRLISWRRSGKARRCPGKSSRDPGIQDGISGSRRGVDSFRDEIGGSAAPSCDVAPRSRDLSRRRRSRRGAGSSRDAIRGNRGGIPRACSKTRGSAARSPDPVAMRAHPGMGSVDPRRHPGTAPQDLGICGDISSSLTACAVNQPDSRSMASSASRLSRSRKIVATAAIRPPSR